jgi:gluconolactonase
MIFVEGLSRPEGPLALADGSWLVVEMGPDRGCVTQISADGSERRVIAKTGRPNGLTMDRNGVVWVAESINPPSLLRLTLDGKVEVFLTECGGEPFLFPNDLCFGPDGMLYMTDTGIGFKEWDGQRSEYKHIQTDGRVYRIDVQTRRAEKVDSGIRFTNGIAFGPDQHLYVSSTLTGEIYRYRWDGTRVRQGRELVGNVLDPSGPDIFKGPDGMAFGEDGLLYVAVLGEGVVAVMATSDAGVNGTTASGTIASGTVVRRIPLHGKLPTNVAFGRRGSRRIYVTEQQIGRLEVYEVETDGLPLYG